MATNTPTEIMILGDGLSDLDGVGVRGNGPGRSSSSIWTRLLGNYIDPSKSGGASLYSKFEKFNIFQGGKANGGSELAYSGQTSKQGADELTRALTQNKKPAMVVIAYTGITDAKSITLAAAQKHIEEMIQKGLASGAPVLLIRFKKPNDTGIWDSKKPENKAYIAFMNSINEYYSVMYHKYKSTGKIALVSDYYAPLRVDGAVPTSIVNNGLDVAFSPTVQGKLFENIFQAMGPLLDSNYKPPLIDRKAIMVVGDHLSDVDGYGAKGFAAGRNESVWTRKLIERVDGLNSAGKDRSMYSVYQGESAGGSELAAGGTSTAGQLAFLKTAIAKTRPGFVIIAASHINEYAAKLTTVQTLANIREMISLAQSVGAEVLLIGFPPAHVNYTPDQLSHARALAKGYASIAASMKVNYVEDFYAPLRNSSGNVDSSLISNTTGLVKSASTEQKLSDNIMQKLAPMLGLEPPLPHPSSKMGASASIMIVGDHYSDVEAFGGSAPRQASVWTRALIKEIDASNLDYTLVGGASTGQELAKGGASSAQQLKFLKEALSKTKPSVVILSGSYFGEAVDELTASQTAANFDEMIKLAKAAGAKVLVVGMKTAFEKDDTKEAKAFYKAVMDAAKKNGASIVEDAFKNLRTGDYVDSSLHSTLTQIKQSAQTEQKIYAAIQKELVKFLPNLGTGSGAASASIMIVGDHYSDVEAFGGSAPRDASVWTRALIKEIDASNLDYKLVGGPSTGQELAKGGASSAMQLQFLKDALSTTKPSVVILSGSYYGEKSIKASETKANFGKMIQLAKAAGAKVLVVGMKTAFEKDDTAEAKAFYNAVMDAAKENGASIVADAFKNLRKGDYVDDSLASPLTQIKQSAQTEQKIYAAIKEKLVKILPQLRTVSGADTKIDRSAIMVVGDSISDLDGVGQTGWGTQGRDDAVWTRALVDQIDGTPSTQLKEYTPYRGFDVFQGKSDGGRELAVSGNNSSKHLERLRNALRQTKPGIVVLAVTNYNDLDKNNPLPLATTRTNIKTMVELAQAAGAQVVIIGFPPAIKANSDALAIAKAAEEIAKEYKTGWVDDYYAPLRDPSTGYVSDKYFKDNVHLLNDKNRDPREKALLKNIFDKALKAAMDKVLGKDAPPNIPSFPDFPGVRKFTPEPRKAGQEPILKFELAERISAGTKFDLKYWAKINDADAGDQNGSIPDTSKYMNYKEFFIRYDENDDWEKVEYWNPDKQIVAKKDTKHIYLKFETYEQSPYTFDLLVNLGGKNYSVLIKDNIGPYLYLKDSKKESARHASDVQQHKGSSTCYLLAALQAAASDLESNNYLENLIKEDSIFYYVKFKNYDTLLITKKEVTTELWNKEAAGLGSKGKELWVRVLELAYLRAMKSTIDKDGSPKKALQMFTGKDVSEINGSEAAVDAVKQLLDATNPHHIVVGTKNTLGDDVKEFRANHAYAVTRINNGNFILWDPIGGKSIEVTKKQLINISERFFITDLKNGDVSTEPFPELDAAELEGEPIPDLYARITLLSEHKIKSKEEDNKYINTYKKNDIEALVKIEDLYAKYKGEGLGDNSHLDESAYDSNNLFYRMTKVKSADGQNGIKKGATYFTVELWQRSRSNSQSPWTFKPVEGTLENYVLETQVRIGTSVEITLGWEFRGFGDFEEDANEGIKRTRIGIVTGITKNYERMTTWARGGGVTKGNPWRLRMRYSNAAEVIGYYTPRQSDAGAIFGFRAKVQLQIGRIDNGYSWWFTLGAELAFAADISNAESSCILLLDALVDQDKERGEKHYAAVLNKLASANVYLGMNGLIQDGVKVVMDKLANKRDTEETRQTIDYWTERSNQQRTEDVERQLQNARDTHLFSKVLRAYGDYFHNFKWKLELGPLWLPFEYDPHGLRGDGKYAGTQVGTYDRLYEDFQQIRNWQKKIADVIAGNSIEEMKKIIPANIFTIVEAIGTSKSFGDAINEEIAKADEAAKTDKPVNKGYRAFLSEMTAPAKTVVMAGLMDAITNGLMNRILDAAETIGSGGTTNFRLPKMNSDNQLESAESYGAYLATFADELVGDSLRSIFTSKSTMLSMLLYAAIFVTESALNKFLEELERKNSGGDSNLSEDDKKSVRQKARAEDYKRFGIDNYMAKDLGAGVSVEDVKKKYKLSATEASNLDKKLEQHSVANSMRSGGIDPNAANSLAKNRGFNFDDVAKDMGWSEDQKNNIREKLENVAKQNNASIYSLIANNAFKSGMTPDQRLAYDILKGNPQISRDVLRNIVIDPKNFVSLTKGLPDSALDDIRERINSAPGAKENAVLKDMAKYAKAKDWLSGLTEKQRTIATQIFNKISVTGVMSVQDAQTISRKLTIDGKLDQLSSSDLETSININSMNAITFGRATNSIADGKINNGASGRIDLLLGFVPLFLALGSNNPKEKSDAISELAGGLLLTGIALALGPVGLAFEVIALAISFAEKPLNKAVSKNPLLLIIPQVAAAWAFNKAFSKVKAVFSIVFMDMIQNVGRKGKSVEFESLSNEAAIYQAYAPYYNQEQFRAYTAAKGSEDERLTLGKQAATSALLLEMLADGVITADSFVKAINEKTFDDKKLKYDLSKIPATKLATGVAYALLSTSFDIFDYWITGTGDHVESNLKNYTNRAIFAGLLNRLGDNESDIHGDHVRFWATYGHETGPDIFTVDKSGFGFDKTSGGYAFVGEGQDVRKSTSLYDTGTRMKPSTRLVERLTYLAELGMLRYVNKTKSDKSVVQVLSFGNDLGASDIADVGAKLSIGSKRREGMTRGIWYYASHHGDSGDKKELSFEELANAINDMKPFNAPKVDWRALEFAVRLRVGNTGKRLSYEQLSQLVSDSGAMGERGFFLKYTEVWGWKGEDWTRVGMGMTENYALETFTVQAVVDSVMQTWGNNDFNGSSTGTTGTIRDVWLGEALWKMGAIDPQGNKTYSGSGAIEHSEGDDAKDFAKFMARGYQTKNSKLDLGAIGGGMIWSMFEDGAIDRKGSLFEINWSKMGAAKIARAFFGLESDDDHLSVVEFLKALNYLDLGKEATNNTQRESWAETFMKNTNFSGDAGGRHFTEQGLTDAIRAGKLNEILTKRSNKGLFGSAPLAPVVLDLDGDGLHFTSLAQSTAQYDIDDSGVRRNVAWTKDGLLAIDADGDGRIAKTSELSFVGYKPGAKTDLEGLTAFDTNGNGTLDAGDRDWRKFVVWIDRNGDGASDAGELATLDKIGISSINLTSDKKRQNLDGVTLHGTTTFTTKDGRKGTVGDVSFDVSTSGLSTAEIARRRDILAQAVATSATTKSASTGLRASGADLGINLNLFASKT